MQDETITTQSPSEQNSTYPEVTLSDVTTDGELIDQINKIGYSTLTNLQAQALPLILNGKDVVVEGPRRGRSLAFGIALAILTAKDDKNRTYVMTDSEGDAERLSRGLQELGVSAVKVGGKQQRGGKHTIQTALVLVGTTQGMLDAFDQGVLDGSKVVRAILDGTEPAIQSGRMEELLNLLHNLQNTQIILVRNDTTMGITNFIKKFLKGPAEVRIAETKEDAAQEARAVTETEEQAPRQSRSRARSEEAPPAEDFVQAEHPAAVATPSKVKKAPVNATHSFFELSGELLAKPNALTDLIEGLGMPRTIVFCNSPSEADLTDVMLRKSGITSRKLIGFVPQSKITSAVSSLQSNETTALVLTDISAREIQLTGLGLVVNYSIHSDPEVYMQRAAVADENSENLSVVSLITPLDLANFYALKKLVSVEFAKAEPPSKEEALTARVKALGRFAATKNYSTSERVAAMLPLILEDSNKNEILALLLHNTLEALPAALAAAQNATSQSERGREGGYRDQEEGDRGYGDRREDRDGGRGGRNNRRDRRGGRDERRDDGDRIDDQRQNLDSGENQSEGNRERRGRRPRRDAREEGERTPYVPPAKDLRLYVGHGTKDGVDSAKLIELVTTKAEVTADQIKRTITRDNYSFIDVAEAIAESVVAKVGEAELSGGRKVFIRKAVTISAPREERSREEDSGSAEHQGGSEETASADASNQGSSEGVQP